MEHGSRDYDPPGGRGEGLKYVKNVVVKTADEELAAAGVEMKYLVGTMIEIPARP